MTWDEKQKKLQEIYDRYETEARPFKDGAVCRLGCTSCCTDVGNVDVNTLEGLIIWNRLQVFPRAQRRGLKKKLVANKKEKKKQSIAQCAFLDRQGACVVYDVRPFSCRQLYSLHLCGDRGPTVHRQAVELSKKVVREMQQLDDTGYSGHISYVLDMLDQDLFRNTYLDGLFDPAAIMAFGKAHHIVINRFAR